MKIKSFYHQIFLFFRRPRPQTPRMRMISAASVFLLLVLPAENCSPPARAPPLALGPDPSCEPWPRRPAPPASTEAGRPSRPGAPGPGRDPGAQAPPALRREARSPSSSRRKEGRPSSLDLTFHLLREFLEMSREERLAQKALSNKWLLQTIGK
ncbi:corticoliberin-like [Emydura macquarii macquarii]|uniref:corticoliberin-like n=1 Tax=Emydura macquarii macquarii TaxID=1129001 RepID=UPI00352A0087